MRALSEQFEFITKAWAEKICSAYISGDELNNLKSGYEFQRILKDFALNAYREAFEKIKPELYNLIAADVEKRKGELAKEAVDLFIRKLGDE